MKTLLPNIRVFSDWINESFAKMLEEVQVKRDACCTLGDPTVKQCADCPCARPPHVYNSLASHAGECEIAAYKRLKHLHADDPLGEGKPYFKGGYHSGGVPKMAYIVGSPHEKSDYYAPCRYKPSEPVVHRSPRIPTEGSFEMTFKPDDEKALIDWIKEFKGMKK